jgi:hypothetical protein
LVLRHLEHVRIDTCLNSVRHTDCGVGHFGITDLMAAMVGASVKGNGSWRLRDG